MYTPQLHTVKNLVTEKLASTILTRQAILKDDKLAVIPFAESIHITSGIVMKKGHHIYADKQLLIDFIKQNFQR